MVHKSVLHEKVTDNRPPRERAIIPCRSSVNQIGVPDQHVTLLRVKMSGLHLMPLNQPADMRLITRMIRRVAFGLEIFLGDADIFAEDIRQAMTPRIIHERTAVGIDIFKSDPGRREVSERYVVM